MLPHAEHVLTTALIVKNKCRPIEYNIGFVGGFTLKSPAIIMSGTNAQPKIVFERLGTRDYFS
jgi:hypothetical protein